MRASFVAIALSALVLGACSGDEETAPSPSSSSSSSSSGGGSSSGGSSSGTTNDVGKAEIDLTFSGSTNATLKGTAGTCGGVEGGFSARVRTEELGVSPNFELAVIILGEEDFAKPPTILNEKEGAKRSYGWNGTDGTVVAQRDRSRVDFDGAVLKNVVGAETATVTGSIVCKK
jgi:hypothetical protein